MARDGGEQRAGDYLVGYAVEGAEGMYEWVGGALGWRDPGDDNVHVEVAVRDAGDGRFVPAVRVVATLRHDEINGRRFAEPVEVESHDVRIQRGQD